MNYLTELKNLVRLHAKSQGLNDKTSNHVLNNINTLVENKPGSWLNQWVIQGEQASLKHDYLRAVQYFNLARFPFVDSEVKAKALDKCVTAFTHWYTANNISITKEICEHDGKQIPFYYLPAKVNNAPLLLVMGGIVSLKEQWGQLMPLFNKLGFSVAVGEMPGVGENSLQYKQDSYLLFQSIVKAISQKQAITSIYMVALSFSGHMAIKYSLSESRVKSIATVGAPINEFFTNSRWFSQIPLTTKLTLSHITGVPQDRLPMVLNNFALSKTDLKNLKSVIYYIASKYDEIIPAQESELLKNTVPHLHVMEFPDIHGSPSFIVIVKLFIVSSILTQARVNPIINMMLKFLLGINRLKLRLKTHKHLKYSYEQS